MGNGYILMLNRLVSNIVLTHSPVQIKCLNNLMSDFKYLNIPSLSNANCGLSHINQGGAGKWIQVYSYSFFNKGIVFYQHRYHWCNVFSSAPSFGGGVQSNFSVLYASIILSASSVGDAVWEMAVDTLRHCEQQRAVYQYVNTKWCREK